MKKWLTLFLIILVLSAASFLLIFKLNSALAQGGVSITARVEGCGNGVIEGNEQCDGSALAGQTCIGLGYTGGTLSCYPAGTANECTFNTSNCTSAAGGGGGGGGAWTPPPSVTKVILQGIAYPLAEITILKDGQVSAIIPADSQANFKVELTTLTAGIYTFGVWAEDKEGRKSVAFSFTVTVTSGMTTTIGGIFIPPTIELAKTSLNKGELLNILGQTAPQSEVSVHIESPGAIIKKTTASDEGDWDYSFNTLILDEGSHSVRSKAVSTGGLVSTYSNILAFVLGGEEIIALIKRGDINADKRINLVDFSILLYNWGVPKNPAADLNSDGKVNLVDFSIMMYWWTG